MQIMLETGIFQEPKPDHADELTCQAMSLGSYLAEFGFFTPEHFDTLHQAVVMHLKAQVAILVYRQAHDLPAETFFSCTDRVSIFLLSKFFLHINPHKISGQSQIWDQYLVSEAS